MPTLPGDTKLHAMRSLYDELGSHNWQAPEQWSRGTRIWTLVDLLGLIVWVWGWYRFIHGGTGLLRDIGLSALLILLATQRFCKDRIGKASWWGFVFALLGAFVLGKTMGSLGFRF